MKLYDYPGAPNPRRVKIFAFEKGMKLELIRCDLAKGEHKQQEFIKKNPSGKIPVLELNDGRCISESVAICRYLTPPRVYLLVLLLIQIVRYDLYGLDRNRPILRQLLTC